MKLNRAIVVVPVVRDSFLPVGMLRPGKRQWRGFCERTGACRQTESQQLMPFKCMLQRVAAPLQESASDCPLLQRKACRDGPAPHLLLAAPCIEKSNCQWWHHFLRLQQQPKLSLPISPWPRGRGLESCADSCEDCLRLPHSHRQYRFGSRHVRPPSRSIECKIARALLLFSQDDPTGRIVWTVSATAARHCSGCTGQQTC